MIERQISGGKPPFAILTGKMIAEQNIFARERTAFVRNVAVFGQPDHRRRVHLDARRTEQMAVVLLHLRLALKDHHDRPLFIADVDRLIRGI